MELNLTKRTRWIILQALKLYIVDRRNAHALSDLADAQELFLAFSLVRNED